MVTEQQELVGQRPDATLGRLDETEAHVTGRKLHAVEVTGQRPFRGQHHDPGGVSVLAGAGIVVVAEADGLGEALDRFAELPEVGNADPIGVLPVDTVPSDSLWVVSNWYYNPFSRRDIHAPEAWDITVGDTSIVVAVLGDTMIVAQLRDPIERAYSAYQHMRYEGLEKLPTFDEAVEREPERLAGEVEKILRDPAYESYHHRHHAYVTRGIYADQVQTLLSLFPRDQILILDFLSDPPAGMERVLDFLGLLRVAKEPVGGLPYGTQKLCDLAMALATDRRSASASGDSPGCGVSSTSGEMAVKGRRRRVSSSLR